MAKFSQKMGGKEVGQASTYAPPHGMAFKQPKEVLDVFKEAGKGGASTVKRSTPVTLGELNEPSTGGIKMRGAGAATKGFMSRGPMA